MLDWSKPIQIHWQDGEITPAKLVYVSTVGESELTHLVVYTEDDDEMSAWFRADGSFQWCRDHRVRNVPEALYAIVYCPADGTGPFTPGRNCERTEEAARAAVNSRLDGNWRVAKLELLP